MLRGSQDYLFKSGCWNRLDVSARGRSPRSNLDFTGPDQHQRRDCFAYARNDSGVGIHSRRAFTLVELLVVIGIMILLASMSVIAIAPMFRGSALAAGSRIVQAVVYQARTYAATQGTNATVFLDVANRSMSISSIPNSGLQYRVDEPEFLPTGIRFVVDANGNSAPFTRGWTPAPGCRPAPPTTYRGYLVFRPSGSIDPIAMGGTGNWEVRIEDERCSRKVIEVIFVSGLTDIRDE